jgi:AcrR family transcriptional regulator
VAEPAGAEVDPEYAALLNAAELVLARGGWWGFKISAVLREARLSTRCFYRHFGTKQELLVALIRRDVGRVADRLAEIVVLPGSATDKVARYVHTLVGAASGSGLDQPAGLYAVHWTELRAEFPGVFEELVARLVTPLVAVLEQGRSSAEFPTVRPEDDGASLLTLTSSLLVEQVVASSPLSRRELEERILGVTARLVGVAAIPARP